MPSADRSHSRRDSFAGSVIRAYAKSRSSILIRTADSVLITRERSCPVHIAGNARSLTKSLKQRRRRLVSCVVFRFHANFSWLTTFDRAAFNPIRDVRATLATVGGEAQRMSSLGGLHRR